MPKRKSLKTYLKVYCKNLSDCKDYRLSSFYKGLKNNPRLEGPLFVYSAMYYPNELYVKKYLNDKYFLTYEDTLKKVKKYKDLNKLVETLPYEQSRALESYADYCDQNSSDNSLKRTYQKKLAEIIVNKSISNYRICKDNGINPGNFHAFMNGSFDRLSLENCRKIKKYLDSI